MPCKQEIFLKGNPICAIFLLNKTVSFIYNYFPQLFFSFFAYLIDLYVYTFVVPICKFWALTTKKTLVFSLFKKYKTCTVLLSSYKKYKWKNEKCCGNTNRRLFRVLPNFHECFYNSVENTMFYFDYQIVNFFWIAPSFRQQFVIVLCSYRVIETR